MRKLDVYVLAGVSILIAFSLYAVVAGSMYNSPGSAIIRTLDWLLGVSTQEEARPASPAAPLAEKPRPDRPAATAEPASKPPPAAKGPTGAERKSSGSEHVF